ncbi:MAG: hypothetical protein ACREAU_01850 [Nitrosopumilaceae archaeon]
MRFKTFLKIQENDEWDNHLRQISLREQTTWTVKWLQGYWIHNSDLYKEEFTLYEGLITTQDIGTSLGIIKNTFPELTVGRDDNVIWVLWNISNPIHDFDKLIRTINNLGWFFSFINIDNNKQTYSQEKITHILQTNQYKKVRLDAEAKYDINVQTPSIIYHITPRLNVPNILQIGIAPKSRSKKSFHPERVYFARTIIDAQVIAHQLYRDVAVAILEIDTDNVPGLRLFQDPNFDKRGFYTINNIPPNAIIREI